MLGIFILSVVECTVNNFKKSKNNEFSVTDEIIFTGQPFTVHIVPKGAILPPRVIHVQTTSGMPQKIELRPALPPEIITTPTKKNVIIELTGMVEDAVTFETVQVPTETSHEIIAEEQQHVQEVETFDEEAMDEDDGDMSSDANKSQTILVDLTEANTRRLTDCGQIRYFCPQCNVRYTKFKYLKTHIKDCGQEFVCVCGAKFKQRRTYVAHFKQKHEKQDQSELKSE